MCAYLLRQRAADRTPLLANLKPSGKYVMEDMQGVGGTPVSAEAALVLFSYVLHSLVGLICAGRTEVSLAPGPASRRHHDCDRSHACRHPGPTARVASPGGCWPSQRRCASWCDRGNLPDPSDGL